MRTFISLLALAACAAADNHETAWVADANCAAYESTIVLLFAQAVLSGANTPVQTISGGADGGDKAWTDEEIALYNKEKAALMTIVGGQIDENTTKEAISAGNTAAYTALTGRGIMWKDVVALTAPVTEVEWLANSVGGFKAGTVVSELPADNDYMKLCVEPIVDDDVEITEEAANWGLTNETKAFGPVTAASVTTVTTDGVDSEVTKTYGTLEGRTGWKVSGGGSDSTNTMQFAWQMDMEKGVNIEAFNTLGMIWGDEENSVDLEYSRFLFRAFEQVKGNLWIDYTWASEKDAKIPVVADDDEARRFLADGDADGDEVTVAAATPNYDHWLRQQWDTAPQFRMNWNKNTEDEAYTKLALSSTPKTEWQIDQRLSKFIDGYADTQVFDDIIIRINMTKKVGASGELKNVKEGGKVFVWAGLLTEFGGLKASEVTDFVMKTGDKGIEVKWAETPTVVEETDDDEEAGGVTGDTTDTKVETKDGASSVTAFGVAIMAAISALAF